jgi:hypothetical protein
MGSSRDLGEPTILLLHPAGTASARWAFVSFVRDPDGYRVELIERG